MRQTRTLKYYEVESDLEAILLEARLINLHQPKFNAIQKDDRSSLYILISKDEFPVIKLARKSDLKDSESSYGPFTSSNQAEIVLKIARRIFKYCQKPADSSAILAGRHLRPCFYYHLGLCDGACVGKFKAADYRKKIGYLKKFLNGQTRGLLESWRVEIGRLSRKNEFELAGNLKNAYEKLYQATVEQTGLSQLFDAPPEVAQALKALKELLKSIGIESDLERIEIYDNATMNQVNTVGAMVVFQLGVPVKAEYRLFKISKTALGDTGAMTEMLRRRFRHHEWPEPDLVLVDGGKGQLSAAEEAVPEGVAKIALAKQFETLVYRKDGRFMEFVLPEGSVKKLLQKMRDEVHRFVNEFHAKRERKLMLR